VTVPQRQLAATTARNSGQLLATDPHRSGQQTRQREQTLRATVLDDDTFVDTARSIIERDFFPDLARLRARTEWIDAKARNDLPTLMRLRERYGRGRGGNSHGQTPIALQTPVGDDDDDNNNDVRGDDATAAAVGSTGGSASSHLTLNEFVATHVSEDDVAYAEMAERDHRAFRERVAWTEESAVEAQRQLAAADSSRGRIKQWPFEVRNSLMWYPHAIDDAAQLAAAGDPARHISKANTRFAVPAPVSKKRRVAATDAAAGVSTVDEAAAYGYVQSPRLQPGVDVAPIMTWGTIGSTPQRLRDGDADQDDDSDGDAGSDGSEDERMLLATFGKEKGPIGQFKVADTPTREVTAHALANVARARAQAGRGVSARPRAAVSAGGKVALSPAAARLARSLTPQRGAATSFEAALRSSYSTPRSTPHGTPLATPVATRRKVVQSGM
jgi:hypothetical protein